MNLLERLRLPEDIKTLSINDMKILAKELRQYIIKVVSENGGHLAPSLGVVELSIALQAVYESPKDKMIWDVGHQAYPHKILTGRYEQFTTVRKFKGLSGFLKREESGHDAFGAGHASTSIAAALGIALARDKNKEDFSVLAIIGDGSMTGGMAYEALNTAGHLQTKMTVVLNDNEMSISGNVGALSQMLNRIITDNIYNNARKSFKNFLEKYGIKAPDVMLKMSKRVQETIKGLILPGIFFEELGFRYIGPVDGHDINALIETFKKVKTFSGPVLLHVVTKKGKGYQYAEEDPEAFHGTPKFKIETGMKSGKESKQSYTQVFGETLCELAENDKRIFAITAAMPSGTGLNIFAKKFPGRFLDVGIAEESAVTIAAGMACEGIKPVVAIYSTFLQRSIDQIIHDAALQKLPVVFCLDRAGLVGEDGATHHGAFDLSYLRFIPNMTILAPADEIEFKLMLKYAVDFNQGPIAIRYPRGSVVGSDPGCITSSEIHYGKAITMREGEDAVIFSIGTITSDAIKAAENLKAKENLSVGVINLRFAKPLDKALILEEVGKHKYIFSLEANSIVGGIGSGINEIIAENMPDSGRICVPLALPDKFIEHGSPDELYDLCKLNSEHITNRISERIKSAKEHEHFKYTTLHYN